MMIKILAGLCLIEYIAALFGSVTLTDSELAIGFQIFIIVLSICIIYCNNFKKKGGI